MKTVLAPLNAVLLTRRHIEEVVEDAVRRGRMTREDAATYLGHKDINSTLVYLTVTQNLLQQASERFRVRGARLLQTLTEGGNA